MTDPTDKAQAIARATEDILLASDRKKTNTSAAIFLWHRAFGALKKYDSSSLPGAIAALEHYNRGGGVCIGDSDTSLSYLVFEARAWLKAHVPE